MITDLFAESGEVSVVQKSEKKRRLFLFAFGALLGAAVFFLVFGISVVNPCNDSFCLGGYVEKDIQQHYAGWLFYRQSSQGWPLGIARGINAPAGVSVAYTDSIPLFAVLFRTLQPLLPDTFQYFGIFTLLCYLLQGGFGALLCSLFAPGYGKPMCGAALFAASPILLERAFRHTSLGAQFLLLAALYYYFRARREGRYAWRILFLLNILSVGIHPYFLPMMYAVTLAILVNYVLQTGKWCGPVLYLSADLAGTTLLGWALGFFYGKATSGGQSLYGYFGMNLNALWNPGGVNGVDYSLFLPVQNQIGGNYDAFAYLGLGILLALPAALWVILPRIRQHLPLCIVCGILTVFAVSHVITANGATLCTLPLPASLIRFFSVFRSGGRLFWPVYDLLVLSAFAGLCRLPGSCWLVCAATLVQLTDLSPAFVQRHDAMKQAQQQDAFPSSLQSSFWDAAADRYAHLFSVQGLQDDALHLALYAAENAMTTNDPFAARYDLPALESQRQEVLEELSAGLLREDTLYLFEEEGAFLQAVEGVETEAWCGRIQADACDWYVIAPGLQDEKFDADCIRYDESYPLRLADYTDALWNRGVLDSDRQTICFADSPFARRRLENAEYLCTDGGEHRILFVDDSDPGWLMVTLDIEDATILWDKELTVK